MIKVLSVGILVFSLSGCGMHYNNPDPPQFRASVTTIDNRVCFKVKPEKNELINSITIGEAGNDENVLYKYNLNMPVSEDKCVDDFGYKFEAGKSYHFTARLDSPPKQGISPEIRIFNADFTLLDKNGKLEAAIPY